MADVIGRWLYRSRQFFGALVGRVSEKDMAEAKEVLGPRLFRMFAEMPSQYRRHALSVYRRVLAGGCRNKDVLQAALLHDAGKYDPAARRHVTLGHRVAVVLLKTTPFGKRLLATLARHDDPGGLAGYLFYPFHLDKRHATTAAARAASLGATQEVIYLIANHHRHNPTSDALAALQAADEAS